MLFLDNEPLQHVAWLCDLGLTPSRNVMFCVLRGKKVSGKGAVGISQNRNVFALSRGINEPHTESKVLQMLAIIVR